MRILFVCLFALMVAVPLSAQQEPQDGGQGAQPKQEPQESMSYPELEWRELAFSAGLGVEANGYPRGWQTSDAALPGLGMGFLFMLDVQWTPAFAAGLKSSYNTNFAEYTAWDAQAFFRWYFFQSFEILQRFAEKSNLFVQAEGGFVFQREPIETTTHAANEVVPGGGAGIALGARFSLLQNLYVEPTVRIGYPWLWSVGATVGYTFHYRYARHNVSAPQGGYGDVPIIVVNYSETPKEWLST